VPERYRSLRAAFDHSWRLLSEAEQFDLGRLFVFRGGFAREAAQQVAGASLDGQTSLIDKSLINGSEAGRYAQHERLRQYAALRLEAEPAAQIKARQEHFAWCLALAEAAEPELRWRDQLA
jgi:predicted ATPase